MKTSELSGVQLDWAVAKAEGYPDEDILVDCDYWNYSTDWQWGGSIIEREGIDLKRVNDILWDAHSHNVAFYESGSTPLVAAMRCYVASKLGDEIDLPVEMHEEDCPAIDGFGCRCGEEVR
jgi:hypothetical protein